MPGVNPQILDAVTQSTSFVLDPPAPKPIAGAMAYQMVAQSGALAIQDATDFLRNSQTMATAANGKLLALLVESGGADTEAMEGMLAVMAFVGAATALFAGVGVASAAVVDSFPKSS